MQGASRKGVIEGDLFPSRASIALLLLRSRASEVMSMARSIAVANRSLCGPRWAACGSYAQIVWHSGGAAVPYTMTGVWKHVLVNRCASSVVAGFPSLTSFLQTSCSPRNRLHFSTNVLPSTSTNDMFCCTRFQCKQALSYQEFLRRQRPMVRSSPVLCFHCCRSRSD